MRIRVDGSQAALVAVTLLKSMSYAEISEFMGVALRRYVRAAIFRMMEAHGVAMVMVSARGMSGELSLDQVTCFILDPDWAGAGEPQYLFCPVPDDLPVLLTQFMHTAGIDASNEAAYWDLTVTAPLGEFEETIGNYDDESAAVTTVDMLYGGGEGG